MKYVNKVIGYPILYNEHGMLVYCDRSGYIFVQNILSGTSIRINSAPFNCGGLQFITNESVDCVRVNDEIGWCVGPA